MAVKELKYFILENYYRRIRLTKGNTYYLIKNENNKDLLLLATKLTKNG